MPSTIVKLSSSDARAWAHNQPVWLDEGGEVIRPVTRDEQHAIGRALERTRKTNQSFRMELPLLPAIPLNRRTTAAQSMRRGGAPARLPGVPVPRLDCAFEVSYVGHKRVVTVFTGKLRYATGREVLAARLLADHGECVMHGRNGKCIGVLRDPLIQDRPPVTGRRVQWSRNPSDAIEGERQMLASVSPMQRRIKRARHSGSQRPTYSPAQCPNDCRGLRDGQPWALAKGAKPPTDDEHHPVCKFASAWASTLTPVETTDVLYDLETARVARPAMPSEIEEAAVTEARTGMRQVTVSGRIYAVLPAPEAARAALEARGEEPDAIDRAIATGADLDFDAPDDASALDEERDDADLVRTPPITESLSNESARSEWPRLDELVPAGRARLRGDVTASDYLARPAPEPHGA